MKIWRARQCEEFASEDVTDKISRNLHRSFCRETGREIFGAKKIEEIFWGHIWRQFGGNFGCGSRISPQGYYGSSKFSYWLFRQ